MSRSRRTPQRSEKLPAPEVWFVGFGDSSLNFELLVWMNIRMYLLRDLQSVQGDWNRNPVPAARLAYPLRRRLGRAFAPQVRLAVDRRCDATMTHDRERFETRAVRRGLLFRHEAREQAWNHAHGHVKLFTRFY